MRGWLCRRKWKIIVQDYICSPHAESMRKRNQIVFNMVEAETEYVHQLSILVNCFLRPLRMAASSKKPPISHDDVSSIFLNRCVSLDSLALKTTLSKINKGSLEKTVTFNKCTSAYIFANLQKCTWTYNSLQFSAEITLEAVKQQQLYSFSHGFTLQGQISN